MKKIVLLIFLLLIFLSCKTENKENIKQEKQLVTTKKTEFNLTPTKPVNGKLKGVVELGASSFNLFIINVDKNLNWELKKKEFGTSLIAESATSSLEVSKKLKDYIQKIIDFGVAPNNIHFVVSSGAIKEDITQKIIKELQKTGYIINTVTPEEEGIYALKCVLPEKFYTNSFVVDIGSGNTKISYLKDNDSIIALESYGAKYFQKKIADTLVYNDIKIKASKIPKSKTSLCFIMGGVPYKLAKSVRKENERFTLLSSNSDEFAEVAKKEGQKVKSGLNIYKAIQDITKVEKIIFDWNANFTIGFLLSETK